MPRSRRRSRRRRTAARAPVVTVIRAGRLLDVDHGTVLRDQVIVVRGDKIASIEPAPGHVPAGAKSLISRATPCRRAH